MALTARAVARDRARRERLVSQLAWEVRGNCRAPSSLVAEFLLDDTCFGGAIDIGYLANVTGKSRAIWEAAIRHFRIKNNAEIRPILTVSRYGAAKIDKPTVEAFVGSTIRGVRAEPFQYIDVNRCDTLIVPAYHDAIRRLCDKMADGYMASRDRVPQPEEAMVSQFFREAVLADQCLLGPDGVEGFVQEILRRLSA